MSALFRIGYGLYVVTCNDGKKDNGLIVNTVTQVSDSPNRIAVNINKQNYSHHIIKQTGKLNVNCLSIEAPLVSLNVLVSKVVELLINSLTLNLYILIMGSHFYLVISMLLCL